MMSSQIPQLKKKSARANLPTKNGPMALDMKLFKKSTINVWLD